MPNEIKNIDENEIDTADQLAEKQNFNLAQQQLNQAMEEGRQYDHPSYFKYAFLFGIAIIVDIIDFADLTGIGLIISKIVSIGGTAMIYLTLFLTNGKMKKAGEYGKNLEASVAAFQTQAIRISKALRKIPGLSKFASKNPLTKILIGGAINLIPFVAIINLLTFWVYLSYRDEKNTYKQAKQTSLEAAEQFEATQVA